jgi:outer membrane receptor protein involved in Fe transport
MRAVIRCALLGAALLLQYPAPALGQDVLLADRGPRFLAVSSTRDAPVDVDVSRTPILTQRVSIKLEAPTVGTALQAITHQTGIKFAYSADVLPLDRPLALQAQNITVAAALLEILLDAGVDVMLARDNRLALVRRVERQRQEPGAIIGRVADAKSAASLVGAAVVVEGTRYATTTRSDGRYRIAPVEPGTYTVRARYIGYAPGSASVTVSAGQEATADFGLDRSAQRLDEVVTTGTVIPTEVKALPTPVSVISDSDIALQRPHTVAELLRQTVPTAVTWDQPSSPNVTIMSVRGASSLDASGQIKIFVDGIEVANSSRAPVNPSSIERIEVIRGPQAGAIYGSDASGGVMQIFTKRGNPALKRPELDLEAAAGVMQTPYSGYGGVLRQSYTAAVRGGSGDASYNVGGGYSHMSDWLPNQVETGQSSPNFYGGVHFARGLMGVDVFARHEQFTTPEVFNPDLVRTGFGPFAGPAYQPTPSWFQTFGGVVRVTPAPWWQHALTVGLDRFAYDRHQTQPTRLTPGDTLLQVDDEEGLKMSIRYNTSVQGALGNRFTGSLTAGFDHYSYRDTEFYTYGATNISGTIQTDPSQPVTGRRVITNNTGYFAQAQAGYHDALFLTVGLRAEQSSTFGDSLGTPISPRLGLSYVRPVGAATVKVRGSWGRAIRAPAPGYAAGYGASILPNSRLRPERQKGFDTGVDLVFGPRVSFSATYYNQVAEDLIQGVDVGFAGDVRLSQYQNVGRVKNTGVELEAAVNVGVLNLRAQYGYARARVEQLSPTYTGDLRPGDQPFATPRHTAGASLSVAPLPSTTLAAGLTYVGSWTYYDYFPLLSCIAGTGPCAPNFRDYLITYPAFVKVNATVTQQITRQVSGFVSVDNLTNQQAFEIGNFSPIMGRITTAGFKVHF